MTRLLRSLRLLASIAVASASTTECTSSTTNGECINNDVTNQECMDTSAFQKLIASYNNKNDDKSNILPLLRGTVYNILSRSEIDSLLQLLPITDFIDSGGYDEAANKDGRAYNAPIAYSGLGLRELSTSHEHETRYIKLLQIREKVRAMTEQSLGLCPGTLLVDFTTISQKTEGGAHRSHADNCLHYFDAGRGATCDPSGKHPYPKRIAASILYLNDPGDGNFSEGEFYFANRDNGDADVTVPVQAGTMVYFTSGVENLHGALPVKRRSHGSEDAEPRRLALAMWYVSDRDQELKEYVPTFQKQESPQDGRNSNSSQRKAKPKVVHDPNDPMAPKELFYVAIPNQIDIPAFFQSMGTYLTKQQKSGAWKVSQYGDDALHVLFKDHSAMFTLDFGVALDDENDTVYAESSVVVERHTDGRKRASLQYMLQESVMMHGVLDALSKFMFENLNKDDPAEKYFKEEVENARNTLPARRA